MVKVNNSKSVICSRKELKMLEDYLNMYATIYELPIFSLNQRDVYIESVQTDYVLIRPNDSKFSERFMNSINKTWNKLYEG
ncbi:MAG: hypothetical protein J6W64_00650 [Bacilli bacterium]|nr:hypothetical protein [Bacilli bacterium]